MPLPPARGILDRHRAESPDRAAALAQYRWRADHYDLELAAFEPLRRRAISALDLKPGERVLDLGCGTGLSFPLLREAVGELGHVRGIEQCPEMLARARQRIADAGWCNVELDGSPVEDADAGEPCDAALLHFTHDILRRREAVDRLLAALRPGARVAATGLTWAPTWAWPVNLFVWGAALYSVTSLEGLAQPWSHLTGRLAEVEIDTPVWGVYLARGVVPAAA